MWKRELCYLGLAAIATLLFLATSDGPWFRHRPDGTAASLTMAELCENEAKWYTTLSLRCRGRAKSGEPWQGEVDEDSTTAIFWIGDQPAEPTWNAQADYLDRCAARATKAAKRWRRAGR